MITSFQPRQDLKLEGNIYRTKIQGLYYLASILHPDDRGYFSELYHLPDLEPILKTPFIAKQVNLAESKLHVCRGFHAEGWNKLVSIISGVGFCALADIRPSSPTYKQVETFVLGPDQRALKGSLFISQGIANSVCTLEAPLYYLYLVDRLYRDRDKSDEGAISLFDPSLNVSWPIPKDQMIISLRDQNAHQLE
jgi:dTDP-4-dehydrorhamnose 3,5-epimerase